MLGHKFNTTSDTEVLIHSLRQWGLSALNKFEGMWAFAWYDLREKNFFYLEIGSEKNLFTI